MGKPWETDWDSNVAPAASTGGKKPWEQFAEPAAESTPGIVDQVVKGAKSSYYSARSGIGMTAIGLNERLRQATGVDLDALGEKLGFASTENVAKRTEGYKQAAQDTSPDTVAGVVGSLPGAIASWPAQILDTVGRKYSDLVNNGVDENTASRAAAGTFAVQAAAAMLPVGRGVIKAALIGGGTNVAGLVGDKLFTQYLLDGNYDAIKKNYGITQEELIKNGVLGLALGGTIGKLTTKSSPKEIKSSEKLFDDLASTSPDQARELVSNMSDPEMKASFEERLNSMVVKDKKQVKGMFDEAKSRGKGAMAVTEGDVKNIFNEAKKPSKVVEPLPGEDLTAPAVAKAQTAFNEEAPQPSNFSSLQDYKEALTTHSAAKVQKDDLRAAFKLEDGTIVKGEPNEPHVLIVPKLPEGAIDNASSGFADSKGNFYTRGEAMERYRVTDAADIGKLQNRPDPVIYMNAGIPIKRSDVVQAFQSVKSLAEKSETFRNAEKEISISVDQLIRNINPEALGPDAKAAAAILGKTVATQIQKDSVNFHQSDTRRSFWDHRIGEADQFVEGMERGATFRDETVQKAADYYRSWNERIYEQDQAAGLKYEPRENYLYHVFKDSDGVARFFETKYGPKWNDPKFLKDRQFDLYSEAKKAGFEPRFSNPEDIMLARQHASDIAEMRISTLRDMEEFGIARRVTKGEDERLPGYIQWRAPNGEKYWVSGDAAQVLHNAFNTKSLWNMEGIGGTAFRAAMWAKNIVVPLKLAISLFHPLHVQTIDNATGMVRASKELLSGTIGPGEWLQEMGKASLYTNIISGPKAGSRLLKVWKGKIPESEITPADKQSLTYMLEGGFIPEMASQYKNGAIDKFKSALAQRSATAALRLPFAAIEALQKPMFEIWIPSLKAASYLADVRSALKTDPSLYDDALKRQLAFRKLSKSVDNRYGEMAYNTLFWNRWIKDVGVASTLSLGWNLGFLREYGGGGLDMGRAVMGDGTMVSKASTGQLDRPMFVAYYTAQALAYGGLLTWAMTGKPPEDLKDYIYPKSGEEKPDGSPARVNTMFYPREFAAIYKHMETEGAAAGLGHLALNKATPLMGLVHDWATNVDYFGKEISDPEAPEYKQLQQKISHLLGDLGPISLSTVEKGGKIPTTKDYALSVAGFSPAPAYATDSKTDSLIKHTYQKYNSHITPFQKAEYSNDVSQLRHAMLKGDDEQYGKLITAIEEKYNLNSKQVKALEKNVQIEGTVKMFKRLTPQQQEGILKQMTEPERDKFLPHAAKELRDQF